MPEIKLFIATSIDGFIAREDGSLDWLSGSSNTTEDSNEEEKDPSESQLDPGGYGQFIAQIDVIIIGRKTYEEILGFDVDWPYANCKTYVITSDKSFQPKTDNTIILYEVNEETINNLKLTSKMNIWLMGGGQLITHFLNNNWIDEMTLTFISIILGNGIKLFPNNPKETGFDLIDVKSYGTGMVNLVYKLQDNGKGSH